LFLLFVWFVWFVRFVVKSLWFYSGGHNVSRMSMGSEVGGRVGRRMKDEGALGGI